MPGCCVLWYYGIKTPPQYESKDASNAAVKRALAKTKRNTFLWKSDENPLITRHETIITTMGGSINKLSQGAGKKSRWGHNLLTCQLNLDTSAQDPCLAWCGHLWDLPTECCHLWDLPIAGCNATDDFMAWRERSKFIEEKSYASWDVRLLGNIWLIDPSEMRWWLENQTQFRLPAQLFAKAGRL